METILSTAFGCAVNVQKGESSGITRAAASFFKNTNEGNSSNFSSAVMYTSKLICHE